MRYFLEVSYKGTAYSGFQKQENAITIQGEIERVLHIIFRKTIALTGSSRTDAGVHAYQNYFHFDTNIDIKEEVLYNLNALLPLDIVVRSVTKVGNDAHCRFDASYREYKYFITNAKNPFTTDTAWFYPYTIDIELLNEAALILFQFTDFTSFSKKNTQVFTNDCTISRSVWYWEGELLVYHVIANRFLRGMVRGLVGTMLLVGRKKVTLDAFGEIIAAKDCKNASFATPAKGLFLVKVKYPDME